MALINVTFVILVQLYILIMGKLSFSVIRFTDYENNFCVVFFKNTSEIQASNFFKFVSLYKLNVPLIFPNANKIMQNKKIIPTNYFLNLRYEVDSVT